MRPAVASLLDGEVVDAFDPALLGRISDLKRWRKVSSPV
jgi:hypothetical protein